VDNALLELHGLKPSQEKEMKIRVKICPKCQERNSPDAIYCKRCASTIDAQAMEWENRMMDQLTKNPQVSRYLRKMLRQMLIKEK
jgi:ribosomal protein L40E